MNEPALLARASDPRGSLVFGMPGGRALARVRYNALLPIAGAATYYLPERQYYFPVQAGMTIVWASQRGFVILKKVSP